MLGKYLCSLKFSGNARRDSAGEEEEEEASTTYELPYQLPGVPPLKVELTSPSFTPLISALAACTWVPASLGVFDNNVPVEAFTLLDMILSRNPHSKEVCSLLLNVVPDFGFFTHACELLEEVERDHFGSTIINFLTDALGELPTPILPIVATPQFLNRCLKVLWRQRPYMDICVSVLRMLSFILALSPGGEGGDLLLSQRWRFPEEAKQTVPSAHIVTLLQLLYDSMAEYNSGTQQLFKQQNELRWFWANRRDKLPRGMKPPDAAGSLRVPPSSAAEPKVFSAWKKALGWSTRDTRPKVSPLASMETMRLSCSNPKCTRAVLSREAKEFKRCSRCRKARYCGPECQKAHWKEHKAHCTPPSSGAGADKKRDS